jgi:hypothetical protein
MSEEDNVKAAHETRPKNVRAVSAGIDTLLWQGKCLPKCFNSFTQTKKLIIFVPLKAWRVW